MYRLKRYHFDRFENLDRFVEWLDSTLKSPYYDLDEVIEDLLRHHRECGVYSYELKRWETKSHQTETYSFDVQYVCFSEDDATDDDYCIYIF